MRHFSALLGAVAICTLALPAMADPKPRGAKPADGQMIANIYVGKTQNWKTCKAGIYYGGKGKAQAYCHKEGDKEPGVGIGKWTVTRKGKVCADMIWYWREGDGYGSKPNDKPDCINHVVDKEGTIWRNWDGNKDWWRLDPKTGVEKGFKYKSKVNRLRRKLGV